jgi:type IV secretion system protein VirB6
MPQTGIFQFITGSIDSALSVYITGIASSVASAIAPLVFAAVTIWIIMFGWATLRGEVQEPVSQFAIRAFKVSALLTLALNVSIYQANVVVFVNGLISGLVQTTMPGSNANIFSAIDLVDTKAYNYMHMLWERGTNLFPIGGYADLFSAAIVLFSAGTIEIVMGGLLSLAKVAISLMLAVGPLFLACMAFGPTKRFGEGWFAKVANYVLLIFFLATAAAMCLSIYSTFVDLTTAASANDNPLGDAMSFLILSGTLVFVIVQLPGMAAGIAGGAAISGGAAITFVSLMSRVLRGNGGGKQNESFPKNSAEGGSVTRDGRGNSERSSGGGSAPTPAYQRATIDRLLGGKR